MNTRPEPKRDRWGRYLLPVPGQLKPVAHTRVTTLVKALDDTSNLEKWACRMTALGLAERADLRALVASHRDDKAALNRVVDQAKEAARSGAGANTGTALHRFAELVDAGMDVDLGEWVTTAGMPSGTAATASATAKSTTSPSWSTPGWMSTSASGRTTSPPTGARSTMQGCGFSPR